jgi:hypothetical protein
MWQRYNRIAISSQCRRISLKDTLAERGEITRNSLRSREARSMELETYIMIAERLGYSSPNRDKGVLDTIGELSRMLTALRQRLIEPRT